MDGVFDHTNFLTSTAIVGCKPSSTMLCGTPLGDGFTYTQGYPSTGWGAPTFDAASQTAIQNGTLGIAYGMATQPFASEGDTADYEVLQLSGYAGTGGGTFTLSQGAAVNLTAALPSGVTSRAICDVRIGAGPNGHLYGIQGVLTQIQTTFASVVPSFWPTNPAGNSFAIIHTNGTFSASSTQQFSDGMIANGAPNLGASNRVKLSELSAPAVSLNGVPTGMTMTVTTSWGAGDPVSATVYIGRCGVFQAI